MPYGLESSVDSFQLRSILASEIDLVLLKPAKFVGVLGSCSEGCWLALMLWIFDTCVLLRLAFSFGEGECECAVELSGAIDANDESSLPRTRVVIDAK